MQSPSDILVIDHDTSIVEMLVELLRYEGYAVRSACSSGGALMALAARLPALILLDGTMSYHETTLLEKLCGQIHAKVPIVIISTSSRIRDSMLAHGAVDFLEKPFDLDELLVCVARHVPGA
jgi:DNA-binding NtrC family response regulator